MSMLPVSLVIAWFIVKEIIGGFRAHQTYKLGFQHGIEAATPIFQTIKYRLDKLEGRTEVTAYIRGIVDHRSEP